MNEIADDDTYDKALERIRKVFADSSEVILAFIGYARGRDIPPALLIDEADNVLRRLEHYRRGMQYTRTN